MQSVESVAQWGAQVRYLPTVAHCDHGSVSGADNEDH